ncbi:MAG: bifunctional isocitrate dehydrogenase kinase/phosphatase [Acidobacteriota bacterium]
MSQGAPPIESVADRGAAIIEEAFLVYIKEFHRYTLNARLCFEARDWLGALKDSADRLDVYSSLVVGTVERLELCLDQDARDRATWAAMKKAYLRWVRQRTDWELAETFFNSITRRVFTTVGVDEDLEFLAAGIVAPESSESSHDVTEFYPCAPTVASALKRLLRRHEFSVGYADLAGDAARAAQAIEAHCGDVAIETIEAIRVVFYRNKEAYLLGRVHTAGGSHPLALALLNPEGRVKLDAVLLTEEELSIVFSYARSYFFVDATRPAALTACLNQLMPKKRPSALYIALGHNKHGKTLLYRELLDYLSHTQELFEHAPGIPGLVMIVFTIPSLDMVFKVIRDSFGQPKTTTRPEVMAKYQLVFKHDRAGRLVDAQEFENLRFERRQFSDELLYELQSAAKNSVTVNDDSVIISHLYVERKMTPLDIYLRTESPARAAAAVVDYGRALRDLAASNIFPGDLLMKNFGVTRHGRVVFYDYDELCLLSECKFRALPQARFDEDEIAAEPWFHVGPDDVFPEEFLPFLGLRPDLREQFVRAHGDLLRPEFWQQMQDNQRRGVVQDLLPYQPSRRLLS